MSRMIAWALIPIGSVAATAGAQTAAPPPEKMICRNLTPTGTIFATRTCRTARQWSQIDGAAERQQMEAKRSTTIDSTQGGPDTDISRPR